MEEIRPIILEMRRARDDVENYSDNRMWNQVLAIFQMICCLVFLFMMPSFTATYMIQQRCMKNQYRILLGDDTGCNVEKWWTASEITQSLNMNHLDFNKHIQQTIDAYFLKLTNWLMINTIAAALHLFSAIFLLLSTTQKMTRFQRILLSGLAKYLNLCYMIYEYVNLMTFGVPAKNDQLFCIICLSYRILFHSKVNDLLDTLVNTSPPPPGHKR